MNTPINDKKKCVISAQKEFESLQNKIAINSSSLKKLSLIQGKNLAYKLINKLHKEKQVS